jgi:hypothetical protein
MTLQGSPPVREFHPPPKVTQQAIPQKDHGNKETLRVSARSGFASASQHFSPPPPAAPQQVSKGAHAQAEVLTC